jgi:hypothetical protein
MRYISHSPTAFGFLKEQSSNPMAPRAKTKSASEFA